MMSQVIRKGYGDSGNGNGYRQDGWTDSENLKQTGCEDLRWDGWIV